MCVCVFVRTCVNVRKRECKYIKCAHTYVPACVICAFVCMYYMYVDMLVPCEGKHAYAQAHHQRVSLVCYQLLD